MLQNDIFEKFKYKVTKKISHTIKLCFKYFFHICQSFKDTNFKDTHIEKLIRLTYKTPYLDIGKFFGGPNKLLIDITK